LGVRGNCDRGGDAWGLDLVGRIALAGVRFLVVHDAKSLARPPEDVDVVVHGHTHVPGVVTRDGVLWVNPGSASQRRSMHSRSVSVLDVSSDGACSARIVMLDDVGPA